MRLLSVLFVCCVAFNAPGMAESCNKNEIAIVDSWVGPWHDQTYQNRPLVKHLSICSDSKLVRLKDGTDAAND